MRSLDQLGITLKWEYRFHRKDKPIAPLPNQILIDLGNRLDYGVIDTDQGMVVFIVDGNMAKAMPVTLGSVSQDQVVVTEGLDVDMPLITVGHRDLVNGELVEVKEK